MYECARPFIKWAGGKYNLLSEIRKCYPENLGLSITSYCEPFVGGGAVLFDILSNFRMNKVIINDINKELIITYKVVRDNVTELLQILLKLQNTFNNITIEERKEFYYKARDNFNILKKDTTSNVNDLKIASLFIFLNKTCFNGLYRVNNNGNFNVSMGAYKNPLICDKNNLIKCSRLLQNVIIECGSYENIISKIDSSTFIYIDPPYRPLSKTSSFVSYNKDGFTDIDQIKLSDNIHHLSEKGIKFIMSNSDPKNYNSNDNFFDELYKDFHIERISALRCINSNTALRNKISELLITNIN